MNKTTIMKKITCTVILAVMTLTASAQKQVILPGKGHINVESLNKHIDLNMDISNLSLSELRILRNSLMARQGYCFMKADLRSIFEQTSWYDSLAMEREENEKAKPIALTPKEQAFVNKLSKREKELLKGNFNATEGGIVNTDNIINPFQLESFNGPLKEKLGENGFAIVQRKNIQLFHTYENNDYHDFPSFVTTDLYMQLFHAYFDFLTRNVEDYKLMPLLTDFNKKMYDEMASLEKSATNLQLKEEAAYNATFYAIGYQLLTGNPLSIDERFTKMAAEELSNIETCNDTFSDFLDYHDVYFPYSLFKPRGHYTRSNTLKRYFKAMMWFQTASFCLNDDAQLRHSIVQASVIRAKSDLMNEYNQITTPLTYLFGEPDNVSIKQLADIMKDEELTRIDLLRNTSKLNKFRSEIEKIAMRQTKILPKERNSCLYKINLMPQRYMPDNEVLQEMVDVKNKTTKRDNPKGLDVMAAFGSTAAERILLDELNEGNKWEQYTLCLDTMKEKMKDVNWNATVANKWMQALNVSLSADSLYPYFMKTRQWGKKNLNSVLASWAELKHDAILYAKQPMAAECGGGGLPEPVVAGYVEPNIHYWSKAIELLDKTDKVIESYHLTTPDITKQTNAMREMAQMLLNISNKELEDRPLTEQEYKNIEIIGSNAELLTLDFVKRPGQQLQSWDDVQGADKSIAVIADVYTSNASNNPNKTILYEGVGTANEIYVIVEIGGYLYLTRGSVLSYREFPQPLTQPRLTDEEWQKKLHTSPNCGVPSWMDEIIIPDENVPQDNEELFYSSGC